MTLDSVLTRSFRDLLVFVVSLGSASGGTINLSSGTIDLPVAERFGGPVHLVGDRGFTFDGFASNGRLPACPCPPGEPLSLDFSSSNEDLRGVATLDGISYAVGTGQGSSPEMTIIIDGEIIAPPLGASPTETIVAPGTFTGDFTHDEPTVHENLVAKAIATITLRENLQAPTIPSHWRYPTRQLRHPGDRFQRRHRHQVEDGQSGQPWQRFRCNPVGRRSRRDHHRSAITAIRRDGAGTKSRLSARKRTGSSPK